MKASIKKNQSVYLVICTVSLGSSLQEKMFFDSLMPFLKDLSHYYMGNDFKNYVKIDKIKLS